MKRLLPILGALSLSLGLAGCDLVEGIFKVGFWAGIIAVVLLILAIWLVWQLFD